MLNYWKDLVNKASNTTWFELRANYEKVAAFSYNSGTQRIEAKKKVFDLLEATARDLYRDKIMQVVEVWKVQTRKEKGEPSFTLDGLREKIIHEEHPTVWDFEWGPEPSTEAIKPPKPYDLMVL